MSELIDARPTTPSTGELNQLAAFAAYLRQHHLDALARENLRLCRRWQVPLLTLFEHLSEDELLAQGVHGMALFLSDLEAGRALETAARSLELWEADELPGLPKDAVQPSDLVLIYAAQKRAIITFLPHYAPDTEAAIAIATALEDYYTEVQDGAFKLYARLREAALLRANVSEAHAEELAAMNEELTSQSEELAAQTEELNTLYDELKRHNERVEAIVAERTEALATSERRMREAQAMAHFGNYDFDLLTGQVVWSDELFRMYGLAPQSKVITFEVFKSHLHPEDRDRILGLVQQAIEAGGSFSYEERIVQPDGTVRDLSTRGEVIVEGGRPVRIAGVCQDVTERKRYEQAIAARNQELVAANEQLTAQSEELQSQTEELFTLADQLQASERHKDEFLNVISHELRTPLNFIMGFASIMEDDPELSELHRSYVGKILLGADRMLALVEDLLDVARLKAGKVPLAKVPTPYGPLIGEVVSTLAPLASQKELAVETAIAVSDLPEIDGPRIVQVLTNLISNAIKFTPPGGRIAVRAAVADGWLVTEVEDTGPGIPPAELERIFDPFHQVDMSATREAGGTGLGLSIVRALVEAHGGAIAVRSTVGQGSTFEVRLPA